MSDEFEISQAQVERVGEQSIGLMRVWEADYTLPSGEVRRGLTARLALWPPDRDVVVGFGSTVELEGTVYDVVAVEAARVRLRRRP